MKWLANVDWPETAAMIAGELVRAIIWVSVGAIGVIVCVAVLTLEVLGG